MIPLSPAAVVDALAMWERAVARCDRSQPLSHPVRLDCMRQALEAAVLADPRLSALALDDAALPPDDLLAVLGVALYGVYVLRAALNPQQVVPLPSAALDLAAVFLSTARARMAQAHQEASASRVSHVHD